MLGWIRMTGQLAASELSGFLEKRRKEKGKKTLAWTYLTDLVILF